MSVNYHFFATTAKGLEDLLKKELSDLGLQEIKEKKGGVHFSGTPYDAMKACLWSRIANRILLRIASFEASTEAELYDNIYQINWLDHFDIDKSFVIDCSVNRSHLKHSQYAALKTKDAIVDQFRDKTGDRPTIDQTSPDVRLNLYINNNQAIIYHDLSGDSLHKRGYRVEGEHAPLKENLAAALLMRSQWPQKSQQGIPFLDPMCGSGTLVIEAAYIAANIAPGILRPTFGFHHWNAFDETQWQTLKEEALNKKQEGLSSIPDIDGYDASSHAIRASITNAEAAGLNRHIHFEKRDITQASPRKASDTGVIVVNPPYGVRISDKPEVSELYYSMGEQFNAAFKNWDVSVFTDSLILGKRIPFRAKKIHSLYNGALECKLLHFSIKPENYFDSNRKFKPIPAEKRSESSKSFANRLKKNHKHLTRWAKREHIYCYRLYDADIPEYAMAIDLYESDKLYVVVQEYEAPKTVDENIASFRLNEALNIISEFLSLNSEQLVIKQRKQQKGLQQYEKKYDEKTAHHIVKEGTALFKVSFEKYLDTGLFLDHRTTRGMIKNLAKGKDFLNLFCYTGSVSVYAALGGAASTTSVDMSNTYLDWCKENFLLNDLADDKHQFIRADCLKWMEDEIRRYDLIFLDPPSFSNSKKMENKFSVQQDHVSLISSGLKLLKDDGILVFSNNFRNFKLDQNSFPGIQFEDISKQTIPEDFKRNQKIHHCWIIKKQQ